MRDFHMLKFWDKSKFKFRIKIINSRNAEYILDKYDHKNWKLASYDKKYLFS